MQKIVKNNQDVLKYRDGMGGTIEIFDIVVRTQRSIGIGSRMIQELIEKENPSVVYAFCRKENVHAHNFYKKNGFRPVDIGQFYSDGCAIMFIYEAS